MRIAATASDHHHPKALSTTIARSVTSASTAPAPVSMPSPRNARLFSRPASRTFHAATPGRTITEIAASMTPSALVSGLFPVASECADPATM